jgi:hypothetical protein
MTARPPEACAFSLTRGRIAKKNADIFMSCMVCAPGFRLFFCFWALALLAAPCAAVAEEAKPVAAVVSVKIPASVVQDRSAIESSVASGLESAGWQVLGLAGTTRLVGDRKDLLQCPSDTCAVEIARLTKAPFLVRAVVNATKRRYSVSLSIFDSLDASDPLAREDVECLAKDPCPPVASNTAIAARILGRRAIKIVQETTPQQSSSSATAAAPASPLRRAAPAPDKSAPRVPAALSTAPNTEQPRSSVLPIVGWAALGSGVGLIAGSVYYFVSDGKEAGCQTTDAGRRCFQLYDDKTRAYLLGGLGLAATLVGGYIVLFPTREHPTTVALTPRGILVGGKF